MKGKSFFVATCSVIVLVFCISTLSFAADELWPKKEGEVCFNAYQQVCPATLQDKPTGLVRLWVMNTGNNNYLVHGSNTEPHPNYPPEDWDGLFSKQLTNGNAIVSSDKILMHMTSSGYTMSDDIVPLTVEVRGWLGTVELDPNDLSGCLVGVGINYYPLDDDGEIKYDGRQALWYTPCPPE